MRTIIIFIALMLIPSALGAWGISSPTPGEMDLLPGERGRFYFQIQATGHDEDISCAIDAADGELELEFDENPVEVAKGKITTVYGSIVASPDTADIGSTLKRGFCVSCSGLAPAGEGSSVKSVNCISPISVTIKADPERGMAVDTLRAPSAVNRVTEMPAPLDLCKDVPFEFKDKCRSEAYLVSAEKGPSFSLKGDDQYIVVGLVVLVLLILVYAFRQKKTEGPKKAAKKKKK